MSLASNLDFGPDFDPVAHVHLDLGPDFDPVAHFLELTRDQALVYIFLMLSLRSVALECKRLIDS